MMENAVATGQSEVASELDFVHQKQGDILRSPKSYLARESKPGRITGDLSSVFIHYNFHYDISLVIARALVHYERSIP